MTENNEEKLEKFFEGNHRKEGEPINMEKLIKIAERIIESEAKTRKEESVCSYEC